MSKPHRVFVTRRIPDAGLAILENRNDIELAVYPGDRAIGAKELRAGAKGATAILSILTDKIDAAVMDAAGPMLKIIANYAVGFDNVDLAAANERGIIVTNTPGVLTEAVAEHAFALMLAAAKRITEADRFVRAGKYKGWGPLLLLGTQLQGKTLGIVGLGRIGYLVAERASLGMGMHVVYYDIKRDATFEEKFSAKFAPLEDLLRSADVVSLHVPLLPSTHHLIDAKKIAMMKKTAILVNTSRGPIVDERALVSALKQKRIAAAGLDVYEDEPRLAPGLAKLGNVVLTPHTASATLEARSAMAVLAAQSIADVLDGKTPQNIVRPK